MAKRKGLRNGLIGWVVLAAAAGPVLAQAQPKKPDFTTIRKTELAQIDRTNVEAWINQQVADLFKEQNDKSLKAQGGQFYAAIAQNVKAADATPKFKEGVATILTDAFVSQYPKAPKDRRPLAAVYVLMALNQVVQPTPKMVEAFTMGLSEPTPGGRMMAATGLLSIRGQLTAQQWSALMPVLQKAGGAETNSVVLSRIYRLLALPANAPVDSVPVAMGILETRLGKIEQKNGWPVAADAEAIKWLGGRLGGLNSQLQDRAILVMARILANTVYVYVKKPPTEHLVALEKVIRAAEDQLKAAVSRRAPSAKPGDVTTVMLENGGEQANSMLLELNKWIGTAQQPGVLNQAPFNFEKGLKIPPPEAAPKPAAAAAK